MDVGRDMVSTGGCPPDRVSGQGPDRGVSAGQGKPTGSGQGGVSGTERPDRGGVRWLSGGAVRPDRGLSGPCPDPLSGCFAVVLQASELGTSVSRGFWMQGHWMG